MKAPDHGEVPKGYPAAFEQWLWSRDGRAVWIPRSCRRTRPGWAEAIHTADPDTLRRRFLGPPGHPAPADLADHAGPRAPVRARRVRPDQQTRIAVARFESLAEEDGVAEIAVVVAPAWRRVRLATALVELLAKAALKRGIRSFGASYLDQNRPIDAMLAHAGTGAKHLIAQCVAELTVAIDRERNERPDPRRGGRYAGRHRAGTPATGADTEKPPDGRETRFRTDVQTLRAVAATFTVRTSTTPKVSRPTAQR